MRSGFLLSATAVIAFLLLLSSCDSGGDITTAIDVSIRPSLLDLATGVLQLKNKTGKSLSVSLSIYNNKDKKKKSHSVTLGPYKTEELGILEAGWMFEPNETVTISCSGYKSATYNIVKLDNGTVGIKKS